MLLLKHLTNFLKNNLTWIRYTAVWYVVGGLTILLSQYLFYYVTPVTNWTNYLSIEPSFESYNVGDEVFFSSIATGEGGFPVSWNDILKCDIGDGLGERYYSVYNSNTANFKGNGTSKPWAYQAEVPQESATCRLFSTITTDLPFGISKTQTYVSTRFTIN